ncbi:DUF3311 domain-containing protein [Listeria costaricensis]|uniref:DUF3311 domain-containing protein n=1 Tax=Listeria costaricensis TaxID=2026604 RepID=UPI000C088C22|nr:DUF3311 domain-containing protein [Listeria costaricensis]
MRKWLLICPFLFILGGIPFFNQIEPKIFGLPFDLVWIASGVVFSSLILAIIYRIDPQNKKEEKS